MESCRKATEDYPHEPDRIQNVGVRQRLFSGATRRGLEVLHKSCYQPR